MAGSSFITLLPWVGCSQPICKDVDIQENMKGMEYCNIIESPCVEKQLNVLQFKHQYRRHFLRVIKVEIRNT